MEEKIKFYMFCKPGKNLVIFEKSAAEIKEIGENIANKIVNKQLFLKDITTEPLLKDMYINFELEKNSSEEFEVFFIQDKQNRIIFRAEMHYNKKEIDSLEVNNFPCLFTQYIKYIGNTEIDPEKTKEILQPLLEKISCDIEMFCLYNHTEKKIDLSFKEIEKVMNFSIQLHDSDNNDTGDFMITKTAYVTYLLLLKAVVWNSSLIDFNKLELKDVENSYIKFDFNLTGVTKFMFFHSDNHKDIIPLYEGKFFYSKEILDDYLKEHKEERDSYSKITKFPCISYKTLFSKYNYKPNDSICLTFVVLLGVLFTKVIEQKEMKHFHN